jgi:photosystem II stability/assembly factor-like uncharacterized protein
MKSAALSVVVAVSVVVAQPWALQVSGTGSQLDGVWFSDDMNGWAVGDAGTVLRTADGGVNWAPVTLTGQDLEDVGVPGEFRGHNKRFLGHHACQGFRDSEPHRD